MSSTLGASLLRTVLSDGTLKILGSGLDKGPIILNKTHPRRIAMDQIQSITNTSRKKGAHLTFEERVIIQTRLKDKYSLRRIAHEIGCAVNTIRNEINVVVN